MLWKRTVSAVLNRLADLKCRFLFALLQIRIACAALSLGEYRSFARHSTGSAPGFSDPTRLTRWTRGFLYADLARLLALSCAQAITMVAGPVQPSEVGGGAWVALRMIVFLGIVLLLPAWTLVANYNARQLGASSMKFTPEWAAGWYFLPPGLFWKPYQVMQEIWKASVQPRDWRSQLGSPLVHWWWALWLLNGWGGGLADTLAVLTLEAGDAQAVYSALRLVRRLLHVPTTLFLLTIIARVHRMQMAHYREAIR